MISLPPDNLQDDNKTVNFAPGMFRARLTGNVSLDDATEDAAILAYEYERRWQQWWSKRRWVMTVLLIIPPVALVLGILLLVLGSGLGGPLLWLALLSLMLLGLFLAYCQFTLPRLGAFGRVYRRVVAVPLSHSGAVWCDAAVPAPDFPSIRDNFFALYRDSAVTGARTQPNEELEDEINRKKWLIGDLSGMLAPLLDSTPDDDAPTPFILANRAACLDRIRMEGLNEAQLNTLLEQSLPPTIPSGQPTTFTKLAREVEAYSSPELLAKNPPAGPKFNLSGNPSSTEQGLENAQILEGEAVPPRLDFVAEGVVTALEPSNEKSQPPELEPETRNSKLETPIHHQIAVKVDENLGLVRGEIQRWEERAAKERAFFAGQVARLHESQQVVRTNYDEVETALEEEIRPTVQRLESDAEFYQSQLSRFYDGQREVIEGARDAALGKLGRELHELEGYQEERLDEQSLLQAEFRGLNEQRTRLETSTDGRFESLKNQLAQLTGRSYTIPPPPVFRSNLGLDDAVVAPTTTEEVLQGLAELRAEARLSTNAVHAALNRYARLRFEPLDDLAQLEQELADGTKWQATRWLGNIINFRQSGQLLALAGEVSDSVGVYLDATGDFERLNARWCALETAIRDLGLASYANRLGEAQQYLVNLSDAIGSLHSSLAMAPHSPEMARPATFQSLYDLAAGLQRELEELGGLAANISRSEERLDQLGGELAELADYIARNKNETDDVTQEAAERLTEVARRQQMLEDKLTELKVTRLNIVRGHIDTFRDQRTAVMTRFDAAAEDISSVGDSADKILKKHLSRSERLLEEARKLRQGLENTIAAIVEEFEGSVAVERTVLTPSELFVPVWYFQFYERPVWSQRMFGFATCYYSLNRFGSKTPDPANLPSLLFFFLANSQPSTRYKLTEEADLATLVAANQLDYPSGRLNLATDSIERLAKDGWLSPWLSWLLNRARR